MEASSAASPTFLYVNSTFIALRSWSQFHDHILTWTKCSASSDQWQHQNQDREVIVQSCLGLMLLRWHMLVLNTYLVHLALYFWVKLSDSLRWWRTEINWQTKIDNFSFKIETWKTENILHCKLYTVLYDNNYKYYNVISCQHNNVYSNFSFVIIMRWIIWIESYCIFSHQHVTVFCHLMYFLFAVWMAIRINSFPNIRQVTAELVRAQIENMPMLLNLT